MNWLINRKFIISLFSCLLLLSVIAPAGGKCESKPVWDFSFIANVSDSVVSVYGSLETIKSLLDEQFDSVNNRYNQTGCFDGIFNFHVDTVQVFSGNPYTEANRPHPNHDYMITLDYYNVSRGNWLNPPTNGILILRKGSDGGNFFNDITLGILTHELGHARGAIDLYAFAVLKYYNPVNEENYIPAQTIMMNPYRDVWGDYTVHLINSHKDDILEPEDLYLNTFFPHDMKIMVKDLDGLPLENAELKFYAHVWYDFAVIPDPIRIDSTDSDGLCRFHTDLFLDLNSIHPKALQHRVANTNILVVGEWQGRKNYTWLPLDKVQTPYLENPDTTLIVDLTLPVLRENGMPIPGKFLLMQNYPNPFNSRTNISFYVFQTDYLRLDIVNILGQSLGEICNERLDTGLHTFYYDSDTLPSGVYFYRLQSEDDIVVRKMMILK